MVNGTFLEPCDNEVLFDCTIMSLQGFIAVCVRVCACVRVRTCVCVSKLCPDWSRLFSPEPEPYLVNMQRVT